MTDFYATYPPTVAGDAVPTYANLAAFPSAAAVGNGALAIALDTDSLYISDGATWQLLGSPSTVTTVGTIDSQAKAANGAVIIGNTLYMQSGDSTHPGLINNTTQTISGVKTFSSAPNLSILTASLPLQLDASKNITAAAIDLNSTEITSTLQANHGGTGVTSLGNLTEATSSVLTITGGTGTTINNTTVQVKLAGAAQNGYLSSTDWNTFNNKQGSGNYITALTGDVTASGPGSVATTLAATSNATLTTLSGLTSASSLATIGTITSGTWSGSAIVLNKGGTGQTTAPAAFNALSPITTTGDIIYSSSGTTNSRLGIGSTGNVLTVSGGVPSWAPPATAGTVTSVGLSVPATSVFGVSGSPVTGSGTLGLTTSGTSGGVPYFSSASAISSSGALTASQIVLGGGSGSAPTSLAAGTNGQYLGLTSGVPTYTTFTQPTVQILTGSGTYTTPSSPTPKRIEILIVGGGGGGAGCSGSTGNGGTGNTGGTSWFNTTNAQGGLVAAGGVGGVYSGGASGGGVGGDSTVGIGIKILASSGGQGFQGTSVTSFGVSGPGGASWFGPGAASTTNSVGLVPSTSCFGAGGSGGSPGNNPFNTGNGGGAGAFIWAQINAPANSYFFNVGGGGTGGTAGSGTGSFAGGAGANGTIVVREYYS